MEEIIVYFHTDCLLKNNGTNHPERKERLEVVLKTIRSPYSGFVLNILFFKIGGLKGNECLL